jgi:glycerol kinase
MVGLTRGTTSAHLARAALEAMAYATLDVLDDMRACGGVAISRLRVDGGATANAWLMQFQANVAGIEVDRPDVVETTALGAAGLAGIAAGVWPDADAFVASRRFVRFAPNADRQAAEASHAGWRRAVRATLAWARDPG